ncbi:restriction endonuclease [Kitasatospora sp. NPDC057512]|uniref:restriction endonuclease n=1 Tax=Kitasatospora sp. NPDC057512 TaxID=3346154 RepID=UPI00368B1382
MIIDRHARVVPPRSSSKAISRAMGRLIGKADRDDQLRALIWIGQCRLAQRVVDGWEGHVVRLRRELDAAKSRNDRWASLLETMFDPVGSFQKRQCEEVAKDLCEQLDAELGEAREALEEARSALDYIDSALDRLAPLDHQLREAGERLARLLREDRERLHLLALREEHFRKQKADRTVRTLAAVDALAPKDLAGLVRGLLGEEGWTLLGTRMGRTVVISARRPAGHTIAIFLPLGARREMKPHLKVADVQNARRAAASARVGSVVVMGTGTATRPARRYADSHGITLVDRDGFEQWAILRCPLDLGSSHDTDEAVK